MTGSRYVLGAEPGELARLDHQHQVWRPLSEKTFRRIGVAAGWKVLDAGCGPGHVLSDLREHVGPEGQVFGVDLSPPMLAEADARMRAAGWRNVKLLEGDLKSVDLPADYFDLVWARWVLSFPPDPEAIVERLAQTLRPGGSFVVVDYNHHGIYLHPPSKGFDAAIRATRELYSRAGGDPWIAARIPALFRSAGLELESYRADVLSGGPDDPAFQWASRFFPSWSEKFVEQDLMTAAERAEFLADWEDRRRNPDSRFFSPVVVTAVGVRPAP